RIGNVGVTWQVRECIERFDFTEAPLAERAVTNRVVVIGGGLSGLTAAHRLIKRGAGGEVVVLESKDRVGGAIWTERRDGFTLEGGADSFITNKPWAVDLCRELGLADQLVGTDPKRRRSFVVHRGQVVPVPEGFVMVAPSRLFSVLTTPVL